MTIEKNTLSSFLDKVNKGRIGSFKGIPGGLARFDKRVYNVQLKKILAYVGAPKSGKSAFLLWRNIFIPWINGERNIKWILYSLEMPVDEVKARLAAMFANEFYGATIDPNLIYSYGENRLDDSMYEIIKEVEDKYLSELFTKIDFIEDIGASNPTGIFKYVVNYARKNGKEIKETYTTLTEEDEQIEKEKIIGYEPSNEEKVFVIVDTLGLMKRERGYSKKDNIDKWMEYCTILKKIYGYTIINLHHLNRGVSSVERRKFSKDELKPELEDIKDTSSIGEFSDMVIAIFNPNVYSKLEEHAGYSLLKLKGMYRSIHVIASRYTEFPINSGVLFSYKTGKWTELPRDKTAIELIYNMLK